MSESADSLYRRGMISERQGKRLGVVKGTKAENSRMAEFDGKEGVRDQGGNKDRGHALGSRNHINQASNTRANSSVVKQPSKGGFVKNKGKAPDSDEINQGTSQRPNFPAGDKIKRRAGGAPRRVAAKAQPSGPEYGGPNSRGDG